VTLICGVKMTHDGGLALVESGPGGARLVAATEAEKHDNAWRHAPLDDTSRLTRLLKALDHSPEQVDRFVVDGWGPLAVGKGLAIGAGGDEIRIRTAPYRQSDDSTAPLHRYTPDTALPLDGVDYRYESYRHAESHLAGAYLTSPAAAEGRPALVLVWDGALFPTLYHVDPRAAVVRYLGTLFGILGNVYQHFAGHVPPFVADPAWPEDKRFYFRFSSPGKVMAYAGLGTVNEELVGEIDRGLAALDGRWDAGDPLFSSVEPVVRRLGVDGASVLASFQEAIGRALVERLAAATAELPRLTLCFAGGSALNIKWNSAIRASGLFDTVWVPPFPNDSGSAIGTACASLMHRGQFAPLQWSVYDGPALGDARVLAGWRERPCSAAELGGLLATSEEPVTVLSGRAELGPRALGHRSILASPRHAAMKDRLNTIKGRESYRPVAPMCLVERSAEVFDPGGADPHMLFDHLVRPQWVDRIPAVLHADGTARLQTVSDETAPLPAAILRSFEAQTGIPVLCNTSANRPKRGFFPDVASAMEWGGTRFIWSEGVLYTSG
jgi:carbamoyltransferase